MSDLKLTEVRRNTVPPNRLQVPPDRLQVPPDRIYTHMRGVFLVWKYKYQRYNNPYFDNQVWENLDEWAVFAQLDGDRWFNWYSSYYDGHTASYVTILRVRFGWTYTYQAQPLEP